MKNYSSKTRASYLPNSKGFHTRKRLALIIIVVFALLFSARYVVSSVSSYITTPFFMIHRYIQTSNDTVPFFFRSRNELMSETKALQQKIDSLHSMSSRLAFLESQNDELRSLLNASTSPRILAGVLARPPYTPYDTVIIDRGSEDGIVENAPVFYEGDKALGYVRSVSSRNALVTLFSSTEVVSTVYLIGPNIFVSAYGEGGGILRLSVPQGILVEEGNVAVVPGLETGIVGSVQYIESTPSEPEQRVYVAFDLPIQSIRFVSVGTTPIVPSSFADALQRVNDLEEMFLTIDIPDNSGLEGIDDSSEEDDAHTQEEIEVP